MLLLLKVNTKCNFEDNETSDRDLNPALGSLVVLVLFSFFGVFQAREGKRAASEEGQTPETAETPPPQKKK